MGAKFVRLLLLGRRARNPRHERFHRLLLYLRQITPVPCQSTPFHVLRPARLRSLPLVARECNQRDVRPILKLQPDISKILLRPQECPIRDASQPSRNQFGERREALIDTTFPSGENYRPLSFA